MDKDDRPKCKTCIHWVSRYPETGVGECWEGPPAPGHRISGIAGTVFAIYPETMARMGCSRHPDFKAWAEARKAE